MVYFKTFHNKVFTIIRNIIVLNIEILFSVKYSYIVVLLSSVHVYVAITQLVITGVVDDIGLHEPLLYINLQDVHYITI